MSEYHISALLQETIDGLNVLPGKLYIDCTLGGGGHTVAILERGGIVLGLDVDQEALDYVEEKIKNQKLKIKIGKDLILVKGNFENINSIASEHGFGKVSGILFDLGVSSHQLETAERGFSFSSEGPLDMRMNPKLNVTAADLVNALNVGELAELFKKYGEEDFARPIAKLIVSQRQIAPITTCKTLAELILKVRHRKRGDRTHPATRSFQALRIAVNDELTALQSALPHTIELLEPMGRLVIISFHSLEDRIVKHFMNDQQDLGTLRVITEKPIMATEKEVAENPRVRSAKLRIAERI